MEQIIESFGIDWRLFLAETVNFLIVLSILYWFVFRKISSLLDERNKTIADGVENAEKAEQKLVEADEEKHNILREAGEQATSEIKAAVETAKQREAQIVEEANTRADGIVSDAQSKGELMKEKIIESSQDDIAKMIVLGAEKVLAQK